MALSRLQSCVRVPPKHLRPLFARQQGGECEGLARCCRVRGGSRIHSRGTKSTWRASQLIRVRRDLIHFPITHYFRTEDEERALAELPPFLGSPAAEAGEDGREHELRVRTRVLEMAIDDYAETLRQRLQIGGETTGAALERYQRSR